MKQIDLEQHEFRSERSRKNANAHLGIALVCGAVLLLIWFQRHELSYETLFGVSAMFGGFMGAGLIVFFNQFKGV